MTYMIGTGVCDVTSFNVLGCRLVQQVPRESGAILVRIWFFCWCVVMCATGRQVGVLGVVRVRRTDREAEGRWNVWLRRGVLLHVWVGADSPCLTVNSGGESGRGGDGVE